MLGGTPARAAASLPSGSRLEVYVGDITRLAVDAIVNAANSTLLGGGGVDGAIHRAAGPELLEACRPLGGCKVGEAKLTPGFRLPARYVIHTVGPVWRGGRSAEPEQLAACYRNALSLAAEHGLRAVAFPAISTGVYGFPRPRAAEIAVETVEETVEDHPDAFDRIIFCAFDEETARLHRQALEGRPPR